MSSPSVQRFQNIGYDLITHEFVTKHSLLGRQYLGVGRTVMLGEVSTGVFGRFGDPLVLDFLREDNGRRRVITHASYMSKGDIITVGHTEQPEKGLSVLDLAKGLGGIVLNREPLNDSEDIVSDPELEFIADFMEHPDNQTAMFRFIGEPGKPVTGIDLSYSRSNMTNTR